MPPAFSYSQPTVLFDIRNYPVVKRTKHADIHRVDGSHPFRHISVAVAIKVPRGVPPNKHDQLLDRLEPFVTTSDYSITRVSPFVIANVSIGFGTVRTCVSPWFENGNALDFVRSHARANKLQIIKDVASAVQYVHSKGKVIGNIHPGNVMITADHRAVLTDVGSSPFTDQMNIDSDGRIHIPHSWPYKPAEELCPLNNASGVAVVHTTAMDVCSFAITAYSIFVAAPPLTAQFFTTEQWLVKIYENGHGHLTKPMGMEQSLWALLQKCWARDPSRRPDMAAIVKILDDITCY